jgi:hypothetical protein
MPGILPEVEMFKRLTTAIERLIKFEPVIISYGGAIMATLSDVQSNLNKLATTVAADRATVLAELRALRDQVAAVQAAESVATAADLDALVVAIQNIEAQVAAPHA